MDGLAVQTAQSAGGGVFEFTILVAWTGLNVQNQTVDEAFMVFAPELVDPGTVALGTVSTFVDDAWAIYTDVINDESYYSTSGPFDITGLTLDPATQVDCSEPSYSCTHIEGTLQGDLDMDSLGFPGAVFSNDPGMPSGTGTPLAVLATFDVPVGRTTIGPPAP